MTNRREFLKKSAMLAGAGLLMPSLLAEGRAAVSASDKINVGLIGCRGMGWSDLSDFLIHPEVNCVAVCDVDSHVLREAAAKVERMRGTRPQQFADYRRLLELNDVDAVIIGTPDHWHCLQLADACAAGKDVYVEKPVANSIVECDLMVEAARRYNRVVQVGQQQRSGSHWHEMKAYIDSGRLGKISKVNVWANFRYAFLGAPVADKPVPEGVDYDMWLGPAPQRPFNEKRFHGSWRMFWDYGGGLLTDWGVETQMQSFGVPNYPGDHYTRADGSSAHYLLNLEVRLQNGKILSYEFDVTDQVNGQPRGGVISVDGIVVSDEDGTEGSGGFDVDVDGWGDQIDIPLPIG